MEITYPLVIDSIGKLIATNHALRVHCHACERHAAFDLQALGAMLGLGHSIMHADLAPKLKCSACGGKRLGLTISPPTMHTDRM